MSSGRFQRDLSRLVDTSRPVALARFGDGEYHVLRGEPYKAKSGWRLEGPSWLRERLQTSLTAALPRYWVGFMPPCCWPIATAFYRPQVKAKRTFATVFSHGNYAAFQKFIGGRGPLAGACLVGPGEKADYKVPADGVVRAWDLDALVGRLLEERRPILVAAGPCACVIVHEYWKRCPEDRRQTILDVGAAIDPLLHGGPTRDFHSVGSPLRVHTCKWDRWAPWSPSQTQPKKKVGGYQEYLAKQRRAERRKRK